MGVLGSGRLANTTSTYSNCSRSREAFRPSMMCFLERPLSVSAFPPQKILVVMTRLDRLHPFFLMMFPNTTSALPAA